MPDATPLPADEPAEVHVIGAAAHDPWYEALYAAARTVEYYPDEPDSPWASIVYHSGHPEPEYWDATPIIDLAAGMIATAVDGVTVAAEQFAGVEAYPGGEAYPAMAIR